MRAHEVSHYANFLRPNPHLAAHIEENRTSFFNQSTVAPQTGPKSPPPQPQQKPSGYFMPSYKKPAPGPVPTPTSHEKAEPSFVFKATPEQQSAYQPDGNFEYLQQQPDPISSSASTAQKMMPPGATETIADAFSQQ